MSLTTEAYENRHWGSYPILRNLLANQKLSGRYEIWPTDTETNEEYLSNLLTVYRLLDSYAEANGGKVLLELHTDELHSLIIEDLRQLEIRLLNVANEFRGLASRVAQLGQNA